jgi:hypothetical protein
MNEVRKAGDITGDDYVYVTDSQDLESLHHNLPVCPDGMTGALVATEDGDYTEVWVTESSRPYSVNAIYERIV